MAENMATLDAGEKSLFFIGFSFALARAGLKLQLHYSKAQAEPPPRAIGRGDCESFVTLAARLLPGS